MEIAMVKLLDKEKKVDDAINSNPEENNVIEDNLTQ